MHPEYLVGVAHPTHRRGLSEPTSLDMNATEMKNEEGIYLLVWVTQLGSNSNALCADFFSPNAFEQPLFQQIFVVGSELSKRDANLPVVANRVDPHDFRLNLDGIE